MSTVRFGIIGAGKVARNHAASVIAVPDAALTAVCSRSPVKAEGLAAQFGARAYTDPAAMARSGDVDAVIVCTPHPAHAASALAALEHGISALVEKPLAVSLADCDAMLDAAAHSGAHLGVISQRRWYAPSRRVKDAIDAGKIGQPVLGTIQLLSWRDQAYYQSDPWRGQWEQEGGGVLVNQAPHQLDLLLWYMGELSEVFAFWENLNHPYIEVEDTAVAVLRFKNGGLGSIIVSNSQKPGIFGKVHIHGENGASVGVQTDGGAMFVAGMTGVLEPPLNDLWTVPGETGHLATWQAEDRATFSSIDPINYYFQLQIADFAAAVRENRPPAVTGHDGRRVVELFNAIYESGRRNAPVRLPL
jgi:predicted dehydrogenase